MTRNLARNQLSLVAVVFIDTSHYGKTKPEDMRKQSKANFRHVRFNEIKVRSTK